MKAERKLFRVTSAPGVEWTFEPSFARIQNLGTAQEIGAMHAGLFGPRAAEDARYLLACFCIQDDPLPLIGWLDKDRVLHAGLMPEVAQIRLAQLLMEHGLAWAAEEALGTSDFQSVLDAGPPTGNGASSRSWMAYVDQLKETRNV